MGSNLTRTARRPFVYWKGHPVLQIGEVDSNSTRATKRDTLSSSGRKSDSQSGSRSSILRSVTMPVSYSGSTADSDSAGRGSIPCTGANLLWLGGVWSNAVACKATSHRFKSDSHIQFRPVRSVVGRGPLESATGVRFSHRLPINKKPLSESHDHAESTLHMDHPNF